jgi:hypothetical protein
MQRKMLEVFATVRSGANEAVEEVLATEEEVTVPGSLKEAIEDEGEDEVFRRYLSGPSRLTEERNQVRRELMLQVAPTIALKGRRARAKFVQLARRPAVRQGGVAIPPQEERGDGRRRQRRVPLSAQDTEDGRGFGVR